MFYDWDGHYDGGFFVLPVAKVPVFLLAGFDLYRGVLFVCAGVLGGGVVCSLGSLRRGV
jgi:hypothetical protein